MFKRNTIKCTLYCVCVITSGHNWGAAAEESKACCIVTINEHDLQPNAYQNLVWLLKVIKIAKAGKGYILFSEGTLEA